MASVLGVLVAQASVDVVRVHTDTDNGVTVFVEVDITVTHEATLVPLIVVVASHEDILL
jgi:hypothetical protein